MSLPFIISPESAEALLAEESALCDVAESIAESDPEGAVAIHFEAVKFARELMWAHESKNQADQYLYHSALQLKLHHLSRLDEVLTPI